MAKKPLIDISPENLRVVRNILERHLPIREVRAFGSRVTWTAKEFSDLDLAIMGDTPVPLSTLADLKEELSESSISFKLDIVDWATTKENFRRIIEKDFVVVQEGKKKSGAGEWALRPLDELAEIVMGQSPAGDTCNGYGQGVPLLNGPTEFGSHFPTPVQFTADPRKLANPGDILFCVRGSTTGKMNWADREYAIGRGLAAIRHKEGREFQPFLKAIIDYHLPKLLSQATGSTFPNVSFSQLAQLPCEMPSLKEQKAIAHVLGTLDDKIEINRKMNETLETMARALFKSWFVDFDPVHAKAEGRQPAGMDAVTASLFPDSFEPSPLGPIPKGWRVECLRDHITAERGLSYKGDGLRSDGIGLPMHNLNSIYEGGGYKHEGIKYYDGEYRERHLVQPGDMIVTNTEQGFDHLLIGHAAIVPARFGAVGLFSHHIYRIRIQSSSPFTPHYLVHLFNSQRWHYWISGFSNGTTINMLPADALEIPLLVVPTAQLVKTYSDYANTMHFLFEDNITQSRTLTATRDSLLPKLLSGELRIPKSNLLMDRVK